MSFAGIKIFAPVQLCTALHTNAGDQNRLGIVYRLELTSSLSAQCTFSTLPPDRERVMQTAQHVRSRALYECEGCVGTTMHGGICTIDPVVVSRFLNTCWKNDETARSACSCPSPAVSSLKLEREGTTRKK